MNSMVGHRLLRHVPVLVRGRPLHGRERHRPFFIVGAARSGTTLLRAVLQAHPDVHIPPETHVLGAVVRAWRWYGRLLLWNDLLRVVLARFEYAPNWDWFDLPLGPLFRKLADSPPEARNLAAVLDALYRAHAARHKPTAARWGDKTPSNALRLPALRAVFPDLRAIHLVRDGRDVVSSSMRLGRYEPRVAAARWLKAVRAAQAFGARHHRQYLELRYETLVREPRASLESIATFLELPFDERLLRHHEVGLRLLDVERFPELHAVVEPIHVTAIGRWREDLTEPQAAEINRLLGPTLAKLGYRDGLRT